MLSEPSEETHSDAFRNSITELQSDKPLLLLVDHDPTLRALVRESLNRKEIRVIEARNCAQVERIIADQPLHAALLSSRLEDGTVLDILAMFRNVGRQISVIVLTEPDAVGLAIEAMQQGADHFLTKPIAPTTLVAALERCLAEVQARRRNAGYDANRNQHQPDPFRGQSQSIQKLEILARKITSTHRPVLLLGETGTGKGLMARWLHDHGPRRDEAFVQLNCAGLKSELLENELFGHARGAFTGASSEKKGLLEVADHGTLFLDEIGDMDLGIQAKLLKTLEEQTFRRLGDVTERRVNVHLLAATHQKLAKMVKSGTFRSDLYFRLSTFKLELPALRHRAEDIPILAAYIFEQLARELGRSRTRLSQGAIDALINYRWPGNIRELRNVLEHAMLLGDSMIIEQSDFSFESVFGEASGQLDLSLEELEALHIERVLWRHEGAVTSAAKDLGIQRSTLYEKIKKYGIKRPPQ